LQRKTKDESGNIKKDNKKRFKLVALLKVIGLANILILFTGFPFVQLMYTS
jgi:hypothetical protein